MLTRITKFKTLRDKINKEIIIGEDIINSSSLFAKYRESLLKVDAVYFGDKVIRHKIESISKSGYDIRFTKNSRNLELTESINPNSLWRISNQYQQYLENYNQIKMTREKFDESAIDVEIQKELRRESSEKFKGLITGSQQIHKKLKDLESNGGTLLSRVKNEFEKVKSLMVRIEEDRSQDVHDEHSKNNYEEIRDYINSKQVTVEMSKEELTKLNRLKTEIAIREVKKRERKALYFFSSMVVTVFALLIVLVFI